MSYLWVLDGRKTNQTVLQLTADLPFFFLSFFTQAGGERAVGVLMCLFIQLLNVSCSIKILNLDNTQEQ